MRNKIKALLIGAMLSTLILHAEEIRGTNSPIYFTNAAMWMQPVLCFDSLEVRRDCLTTNLSTNWVTQATMHDVPAPGQPIKTFLRQNLVIKSNVTFTFTYNREKWTNSVWTAYIGTPGERVIAE